MKYFLKNFLNNDEHKILDKIILTGIFLAFCSIIGLIVIFMEF